MIIGLLEIDNASNHTLRLVDLQGNEALRTALPANAEVVGTVHGKVAIWDGRTLRAVGADGTISDVAQGPPGATAFFLSADGALQLWVTEVFNGAQVHSTLSFGGRAVMDGTEQARYLRPVAKTAQSVVVEHMPIGIGGYYLFDVHSGAIDLLDVASGSQRRLGDGSCSFQAIAGDGTLACFSHSTTASSPPATTLRITPPSGAPVSVALPPGRFTQAGAVSFAPGTTAVRLVLGGSPSLGSEGKPEQYETDIVDVATGAIRQLAAGVRPANSGLAWLPDGNLLCYTPMGAVSSPGVYQVSIDGSRRLITSSAGAPVAVLTL